MTYQGKTVEVFAWAPDGKAIPALHADCPGEKPGDYAFVDGKAMEWNGFRWVSTPWKDFAVWKVAASS
jgi:hypothetical protein